MSSLIPAADPVIALKDFLAANNCREVAVLTDTNTEKYCLPLLKDALGQDSLYISLPAGEQAKSLENCEHIWTALLEAGFSRQSLLINLGGGVITDIGGFAAATFKRGIRFLNIPTSLMGMVDAAIGGKTGINLSGYKNQVGVFAEPEGVLLHPPFLDTLPRREKLSGFAEVVKYALIGNAGLWDQLRDLPSINDIQDWTPLISYCAEAKVRITEEDPLEKGIRKLLNFGHTIGHALESLSHETDHPLTHGEAVALGMIGEAYLSVERCRLPKDSFNSIKHFILKHFPPFQFDKTDEERLIRYMLNDKKNAGREFRLVLLAEIGHAEFDIACRETELTDALAHLRQL